MACGFPLSDPEYSAFHPLFFLLRCNLDRLYELHLQMFDHAASCGDMEQHQRQLHEEKGESDLFQRPLESLVHPFDHRKLMPSDAFSTQDLGYVYDELPSEPLAEPFRSGTPREDPVYAAFKGIDPQSLKGKSYLLHVFAFPRSEAETWRPPAGGPEAWMDHNSYVGCHAVMGRPGLEKARSQAGKSMDVLLEVQQALVRQRLSRHETRLRVMCVDQLGDVFEREETPIPAPVLVGPLFEDATEVLRQGSSGGEVRQLQERLSRLGYSPGEVDGRFGERTEEAVKLFQRCSCLKEDGVAGRATKLQLTRQRYDLQPDLPGPPVSARRLAPGRTLRYRVHALPYSLERNREPALAEISQTFAQWGEALGVKFEHADGSWPRTDVVLSFADLSANGADFHGGLAVQGGQLSEVTDGKITLDAGEHWLLQRDEIPLRRPQAVRLQPVLLHAVGHFVGLVHSASPQDVMWPYYEREHAPCALSSRDAALARERAEEGGCRQQ